jgi:UDP-N-acetylmuramoyl-L-alanyl-D-glutamate--2,6-diaminopimelate ligase
LGKFSVYSSQQKFLLYTFGLIIESVGAFHETPYRYAPVEPNPMPKLLSQLIADLTDVVHVTGEAEITAPVVESDADLQPGGVFVARKGMSVDGHQFIPKAIEKGAAAIVGEAELRDLPVPYVQVKNAQEAVGYLAAAYHDYPSRKLIVIGVTGTDGKTTTSTMIHSILKEATKGKAGLISTVNADLGGQTVDTGFHVTTPGAPQIQVLLAQMVDNGLTHCVLEMTSHGLAQGRLNGVDLDVAVLTNLTHEHLDYHGTFENYRAAKGRMFEMLGKSYRKPGQEKISVINYDDANAEFFLNFPADRKITYGLGKAYLKDNDPDIYPEDWNHGWAPYGVNYFGVPTLKADHGFTVSLPGVYNLYNGLAAIAVGYGLNLKSQDIFIGVWQVEDISGRMELIDEGQDFVAIVDFAHTPNALKNALEAAGSLVNWGRIIAVFGSAGLRDKEKRRLMAEASAELADFTILTAEDPRTESLDAILEEMAQGCISKGGVEGETFIRVHDRGEALYRACQMAKAGDVVIACGKGHEQSMCFGTVEYPWDDREAMRAALRGMPLRTLPTAEEE